MNTIDKLFNELVEQAAAAAEKRVLEQLENMITPSADYPGPLAPGAGGS